MKQFFFILTTLIWVLPAHSATDYEIFLSPNAVTFEEGAGKTFQLKASLYESGPNYTKTTDVTESEDMVWSSSDPSVATVDNKGLVTIHTNGTATIQITTDKYPIHDSGNGQDKCHVTSLSMDGAAMPMLREDLVWVGKCHFGPYRIQVDGDTVVNGTTYKKVYRRLNSGEYPPVHDTQRMFNVTLSESTPVACIREANGRVYRLCEKMTYNADGYNSDWDDPGHPDYSERYHFILNATDTHYEVVMYDFNNPNIYNWNKKAYDLHSGENVTIAGDELRVFRNDDVTLGEYDGTDEWWDRYDVYNEAILMVEGLGILRGGKHGRDWLCPCREQYERAKRPEWHLGIDYVRNSKGVVLAYDDYLCADFDDEYNPVFAGDPYDFSGDRNFDIEDLNAMINIMIGKQEDDANKTADLTFDSAVDIEDLNLVINRMVSGVQPVKYSDLLKPSSEY